MVDLDATHCPGPNVRYISYLDMDQFDLRRFGFASVWCQLGEGSRE